MARKAKTKSANNDSTAPIFRASNATQRFLATMNQNHRAASLFKFNEYTQLVPISERKAVMDDLLHMHFRAILDESLTTPAPPQPQGADSQIDEDDIHEIIDTFKVVGLWCEKFTPTIARDDAYNELKRLVGLIANLFDLIPGPHQCPALPPPPPPCSHPHRDDEDIPMELPAPTRVFSEAASQTPAPSHEATTPPPPHAVVATLPAAAASIPPVGPPPPFVCGPPHAPAAQPLTQAQQPILSKRSKRPFYATRGPSRRQFFIEAPSIPKDTSLPSMVKLANNALVHAKSTLRVNSARFSPRGITCATANVPSTSDLDIIEATLSGGLLGVRVCIPASRSFIKIVDIPFFKPGTTEPIPSTEVGAQLQHSIIPSNYVCGSTSLTHNEALKPLNSSAAASSSTKRRSSSKGRKPTPERLSASDVGIGVIILKCVTVRRYAAPSALALTRRLVTDNSRGVAEATPRSLPPSHPPQRTCLAHMSWIRDWAIWDASARKGVPPPPSTPCGNKPPPRNHTLRPPQQSTSQPSLPPIHEDDEGDDDDMAPFGLALDDDYKFHE
ncbi:hypothetical protein P691DRAFT_768507 [Macrolepiota fuliginosa MF-IS2]|uniref:Uncharacterized protein n=1 Tax=Macrolepiota fuliginosa MF-IS2 TaxID=1400762 RepID=A0A9P6BUY9_9AGAR|nr:hypothetical protein P691DRAFT_768507 [Macrolepiota fuliginosa MF-IS2]